MAIRMQITETTPTKMILELNPEYTESTAKTYAYTVKTGRGCIGVFALFFILVLSVVGFYAFDNSLSSLPWSFWVFAIFVLIAGSLFVFFELTHEVSHKNEAHEVTTTIDLDSQQAIRVEKLNSGKVKQDEIRLDQVSRILIHCEESGHSCKATLDSQSKAPLEINSDVFFGVEPMKSVCTTIGRFLNKPVVLKITDSGNLVSEETI